MLIYNLWKPVEQLSYSDLDHIIQAYQALGLSCVSNLYDTLSLDTIKKESVSPYGLSCEITPHPFEVDNKLIFTTRNGDAVVQVIPNTQQEHISEEYFQEVFDNYFMHSK